MYCIYLIPIVPIFVLWDGIASWLRTYYVIEMHNRVNQLKNKEHFNWEINRLKSGPSIIFTRYTKIKLKNE